MGSWNTSCSLSRMPIEEGDEVVGISLKLGRYKDHFVFSSLPVTGYYGDYGRICDDSDNPIFELNAGNSDKLGIFLSKDIYDIFSENTLERGKLIPDNLANSGYAYSFCLEKLGFILKPDIKLDNRYYLTYEHPKTPSCYIISDGTWCHMFDKMNQGFYSSKDVVKYWKNNYGVQLNDEPLNNIKRLFPHFLKIWKDTKNYINIIKDIKTLDIKDKSNCMFMGVDNEAVSKELFIEEFNLERDSTEFLNIVCKLSTLYYNFRATSTPFQPRDFIGFDSVQCPDYEDSVTLYKESLKIINKIKNNKN